MRQQKRRQTVNEIRFFDLIEKQKHVAEPRKDQRGENQKFRRSEFSRAEREIKNQDQHQRGF